MHSDGIKLLNLMFKPDETICVSDYKYGYHSMPLVMAISDSVKLVSPDSTREVKDVHSDKLTMVALNPIRGFRQDINCTAFRNFLVELDYGTSEEQLEYIERLKLPYSAIIFSGGKSLHCLISLDQDLPNEKVWRDLSEWSLAIMSLADDKTKNPSRSIRVAGAIRETGNEQSLVKYKGKTKLKDFIAWLNLYSHLKPEHKVRKQQTTLGQNDFGAISPWVAYELKNGLSQTRGRNVSWFSIAVDLAQSGFNEDDAIAFLGQYFTADRTFPEREWLTAIHSGYKYAYEKKQNDTY